MTTRCRHPAWSTVRVREAARIVVLGCTTCSKRRQRDLAPCPDCHHLPHADRMRCETCPYAGWVLAAEPPPSCCCFGLQEPLCEGCAVASESGQRLLYHICDVPTPEEEEQADRWAMAGPVARSTTSQRSKDRAMGMQL